MGIQNFPAALQPIIQQNFLEREFQDGLQSRLGYRAIADREPIPVAVGETITKTRTGLKAPATTPLTPAANTNLDNGLTPAGWSIEQYTLAMNMFGDTIDLNIVTSRVGLASQFLTNAKVNGTQAIQTLDRLARFALYDAHMGGNTRVRTTLGAPAATINVDDIRGFQNVIVNGVVTAVSVANTMAVTVGSNVYTLQGATADGGNVTTAPRGISGTLTFTANVTVADGTAGNAVVSSVAPVIIRPNARTNTSTLINTDLLTMQNVLNAIATLRGNNVPDIGGRYNVYLSDLHMMELFQDADFKTLFRGEYGSSEFQQGRIVELLGARFVPTNEVFTQTLGAVPIRRAIIAGQGALIEGDYSGMAETVPGSDNDDALINVVDDIVQVTREPLDRLHQIIAQSWYWIGGYAVPTDQTANTTIIPTASNSNFKRALILETA